MKKGSKKSSTTGRTKTRKAKLGRGALKDLRGSANVKGGRGKETPQKV